MALQLKRNTLMALASMRARRGRSFLSILGVIIAVASVSTIVSIGRGIQSSVASQTNQYNKNIITVRPAQIGAKNGLSSLAGSVPRASITTKDVQAISKLSDVRSAVPLTVVGSSATGDRSFNGIVFAASSDLSQVINQQLAFGAYYTSKDETTNVAVLGADAADRLFDQKVPLGRSFYVRGQQFIVSGVLERFVATPFAGSSNFNNAVFVSDSARSALAPGGAPTYELLVKVDDSSKIKQADAAITSALAKAHGSKDDFEVLSPSELADDTTATFSVLTDFVIAAAIITLLVSGISIMNVMLVSVSERMHEIGIRKAVGATNMQILSQFVTEAAIVSLIGSLWGAIISFVAVWLLRVFTNLQPVFDYPIAGIAIGLSCAFGILFGTLPAIKAARKDPISALRSEQ